jgi:hypothetical protein
MPASAPISFSVRASSLGASGMTSSASDDYPDEHVKRIQDFHRHYGLFLQLWQTFELMVEMVIMRQLKLTHRQTSIVCGGINFQAKLSIALTLLKEDKKANEKPIAALSKARSEAERNDFVHSLLSHSRKLGILHLLRREVRPAGYSVDRRVMTPDTMREHGDKFADACEAVMVQLNISQDDIDAYVRAIESHV